MNFLKQTLSAVMLIASSTFADSFVGELDTNGKFPAVVTVGTHLGEEPSRCSGTALTRRLVITAAHCLWVHGHYRSNMLIGYREKGQELLTPAPARRLFVPERFKELDAKLKYIDGRDSGRDSDDPDDRAKRESEDLGLIITDRDVPTQADIHTILDPSLPFANPLRGTTWPPNEGLHLSPLLRQTLRLIKEQIEPVYNTNIAYSAGYGRYICDNYEDQKSCKMDSRLRWGRIRMDESWTASIGKEGRVLLNWGHEGGGVKSMGFSPIRSGDSGGPLFLEDPQSKGWLLIGVNSSGTAKTNSQSTLLHNASFILSVIESAEHRAALQERDAIAFDVAQNPHTSQMYVGFARGGTKSKAIAEVLDLCREVGDNDCRKISTIESGCGYIAWTQNGTATGYVIRAEKQEIAAFCASENLRCGKPKGGCLLPR